MRFAPLLRVGKRKIEILRKAAPTLVKGRLVESSEEEKIPILASVQPAKYHELLVLPEALRSAKAVKLYTTSEIRSLREGSSGHPADEFIFEGDRYIVLQVQSHSSEVLNHHKAIASRKPITP